MSETIDAPVESAPEPADDLRAAIGAAWDDASPADTDRDERGRFAGGDTAEPEAAPEPSEPEAQAEAAPAISPPATLGADDVSRWATLPREAQEFIAAREAKAHEAAQASEPVQSVLRQYEPLYAARGIAAPQAIASLFEAQRMLETRPHEAIAVLARQYGVPFPQADAGQYTQADPLASVHAELQQLKAAMAQRETSAINATINEFAAKPANRHFPTVRTYMGGLMQSDPSLDMARAYEMACRAHPEVSKSIAADTEKAARAEKVKAANEAKSKAVSVRGGPPPVNGHSAAPDSIRGVLSAVWDGALH